MAYVSEIVITEVGQGYEFETMLESIYKRLIEFIEGNEGIAHYDGEWEIKPIDGDIDDTSGIFWELSYLTKVNLVDQYNEDEEEDDI